eukprot:CAMPEP_0113577886 /NCGR_PEP_ID=MMETSP0015_2-20120614/29138_1 /TAXON_ID=2838 /ORGANISM="Odontella" /LENGTH=87 /DNA_ID=CAMNT_0000481557 /DNA_START=237 /DNA_END=497 /DNA_ORIENTATION=+ /assembly_acc=CAM_ASM_000160
MADFVEGAEEDGGFEVSTEESRQFRITQDVDSIWADADPVDVSPRRIKREFMATRSPKEDNDGDADEKRTDEDQNAFDSIEGTRSFP